MSGRDIAMFCASLIGLGGLLGGIIGWLTWPEEDEVEGRS